MKREKDYLKMTIPFNKPYLIGEELKYIVHACSLGKLSGNGFYTEKSVQFIEKFVRAKKVLLTHSCTGALEMMAILANIKPGDEVIMPSFTFTSTANAIVLRGGIPVFIDIRSDTLNLDEMLIEAAITSKTKAILVVHYAGIACEMDQIINIAHKYKLMVLEDAAQGFLSTYKGRYLGTLGDLGAYSFHETKNIISGEGGALVINNEKYIKKAEIILEKGTNRNAFFRGEIDKYTWIEMGSSYLPSEITAAFLFAQLENVKKITKKRKKLWEQYHANLLELELKGFIKRPTVPKEVVHNGHLYYVLVSSVKIRDLLIRCLKEKNILSIFHYIPLHSSPAGRKFGRYITSMNITNKTADTIVRLPLYYDLKKQEVDKISGIIADFFGQNGKIIK